MLHPHTELKFVNQSIGYGVFATRHIPAGTITWVRDALDQTFSAEEIATFDGEYREILEKYTFIDAAGQAVLCWDLARYLNHSCSANCLAAGYDFEIAIRDIEKGEELTDDYGSLNLKDSFKCLCGGKDCRRTIYPDDLVSFCERWDADLRMAFARLNLVEQPLKRFIKNLPEIESAIADPSKMRSCRFNHFPHIYAPGQQRRAS